jgi:hypothetical protein
MRCGFQRSSSQTISRIRPRPITATLSYPAADVDASRASLTVRQREADPRSAPTDLKFTFEGTNKVSIKRPAGFDAGAIYELIYLAKDPAGA